MALRHGTASVIEANSLCDEFFHLSNQGCIADVILNRTPRSHHHGYLPTHPRPRPIRQFREGTATAFFIGFCEFSAYRCRPISQHLCPQCERIGQPVGGFEKDDGAGFRFEALPPGALGASFAGEEPVKGESISPDTGECQGSQWGTRPR